MGREEARFDTQASSAQERQRVDGRSKEVFHAKIFRKSFESINPLMISSAVCRHSAYWLIGCAGTAALSVVEMCAGTTKMLVFAGTLCRHTMLSVGMKGEPLFFFFLLFSFLGSREAPQALCFATKGLSRQEIRVFLNFALRTETK